MQKKEHNIYTYPILSSKELLSVLDRGIRSMSSRIYGRKSDNTIVQEPSSLPIFVNSMIRLRTTSHACWNYLAGFEAKLFCISEK